PLLKAVRPVERFFKKNCVAHDLAVVSALPRYLTKLYIQARSSGFTGENFDLFLLLGDVVTWPSERAFEFAGAYLSRGMYGSLEGVAHCHGLKIPSANIVTVPGNHDKLMQRDLRLYH